MALKEDLEKQGNWLFKYRSFLPLIILLIGLGLHLMKLHHLEYFSLFKFKNENVLLTIGLGIGLLGLFIRVYTVGYTPKNTSGRNTKEGQLADELNVSGIYSLVRHPLYLGNFLMWLGPVIFIGHFWFAISFIFIFWVYYERIMFAEEEYLRRKFSKRFLSWSDLVPAFFPKRSGFAPPEYPYSLKKVFKKEKNGLFALFLIFFIFDSIGELVQRTYQFNALLLILTVATGILYLVLKFLERKTTILNEIDR